MCTGAVFILLLQDVIRSIDLGLASWQSVVLWLFGIVTLVPAASLFAVYQRNAVIGFLPVLDSRDELEDQTYVLYLRPFDEDRALFRTMPLFGREARSSILPFLSGDSADVGWTGEQRLVHLFRRFGKVVAVGRPGEQFPLPGAERFYLPETDWKPEVSDAMQRARLVLILASITGDPKRADGTLWEYTEAVRLLPPSRLLLVVSGDVDAYEQFRRAANHYFATRTAELRREGRTLPPPPDLPPYPPLRRPRKLTQRTPLHGVIHFDNDWGTPEFVRFDPTAERGVTHQARWRATVRQQLDPLMELLERRLPGQVVDGDTARYRLTAGTALGFMALGFMALSAIIARWGYHNHQWPVSQTIAFLVGMCLLLIAFTRTQVSAARSRRMHSVTVLPPQGAMPGPGKPPHGNPLTQPPELAAAAENAALGRLSRELRGSPPSERTKPSAGKPTTPTRTIEKLARKWGADMGTIGGTCVGGGIGLYFTGAGEYLVWVFVAGLVSLIGLTLRFLTKVGRLVARPFTPEDLNREPCVLYVRPRPGDTAPPSSWKGPLENDLKLIFNSEDSLFVTAGDPEDIASVSGVFRLPLGRNDAKTTLTQTLPHAYLVLIPAYGSSPDTLWQLTEAVRLVPPHRLLLPVPAGTAAEAYRRFRQAAADAFAAHASDLRHTHGPGFRPPVLPPVPHAPTPPGAREPALHGVVHFTSDWQAAFRPFDPVPAAQARHRIGQLRHLKVQLQPFIPPPLPGATP